MSSVNSHFISNKNIFLISPEAWDFVYVSKHHYAMELANRGNKVYFINPPRTDLKTSMKINAVKGYDNLFTVDYKPLLKGVRFLPKFIMHRIERKLLQQVEKMSGVVFDIVWNFENSRFYDLRFVPKGVLKIYFQVDEDQNFHPLKAAASADLSLAINDYILGLLKPVNPNSYKIGHSFQGNFSEQAKLILDGGLAPLPNSPVRVMYIGNLEHGFINKELFEEIVQENPAIEFKLVGPYDKSGFMYKRMIKYSNVIMTGKVEYDQIPELLSTADVLILLYKKTFLSSPHKLLEYLASGKTIVSTAIDDLADFKNYVQVSTSNIEFHKIFKDVVQNPAVYNSTEEMKKRIAFAKERTYSRQLDKIDELLSTVVFDLV